MRWTRLVEVYGHDLSSCIICLGVELQTLTFSKVESVLWLQQKLRCLIYDVYVNMRYELELERGQRWDAEAIFRALEKVIKLEHLMLNSITF